MVVIPFLVRRRLVDVTGIAPEHATTRFDEIDSYVELLESIAGNTYQTVTQR
jgi:hypothetical protein